MNRLAAVLMSSLALAGCAASAATQSVEPGADVTLARGETVAVKGAGTTVQFVDVIEDSRCPQNAACFWAGQVRVRLEIRGRQKTTVELLAGDGSSAGGLHVTLLAVAPSPVRDQKIAPQEYRATLKIELAPKS